MLNLVWLNLVLQAKFLCVKNNHLRLFFTLYKGAGGLNCALLYSCERSEAKELPFVSTFLFSLGEEGVLLTKRRPFLSQALSNPTAREMWRHCFADAKRRKFKFSIFAVRVSVGKI